MHMAPEEEAQHLEVRKTHWLARERANTRCQMQRQREEECRQCWAPDEEKQPEQQEKAHTLSQAAAPLQQTPEEEALSAYQRPFHWVEESVYFDLTRSDNEDDA